MNLRSYESKVILIWAEAIGGNKELRTWLMENGYPELGVFVHALNNQDEARTWLMKNGFEHLMALINGAEGNPNACLWLRKYELDVLEYMARTADNDENALMWLLGNDFPDMAQVALKMRTVKNEIESRNNGIHKISPF
jgi:hypothetical protein